MSTTIDSRVVEMRFDNQNFERNAGASLSTLEKLKQSLHLTGATKGLENVNAAAKNCNLSPLSAAAETVHAKFSAMEVMAVTALANITNSAVNAGKRIVSALTIDPVMTGFSEYETKINAVQTIMSNTASKGTTMADVTKTLNELNTYADKTIYNFAEMTRNIGTFTAAGVGLEESASAIQGIANLAAASGSTSQQASTAMYQLSQALAAGTVKLMDWNSVVNAGMGGEKFQEALKATAREHGVAVDSIIEKNGSFRESLSDGWISAEILNDTLRKFTVEGAKEYSEAMVKSGKYTQAQADALMAEAQSMEDAATKVKTFTQLWDTMKESVQSGWAQTWELLIGDFEEAKSLLTGLSDFFGGIIAKISDARNYVLESALGKSITVFSEKLNSLTAPVKETVAAVKDLGDIVNKVLIGDFGNGADRIKALTEAGYDYAAVQNKVNEKLGVAYRHTEKLTGAQEGNADGTKDQTAATIELNDEEKERIKSLLKMTEAELRSKGYTDEQIKSLRELGEQAKNLGVPIDEFVDNLDKLNGRFLLLNGFKNIGRALVKVFQALGDAWNNVFNPPTLDEQADGLFNIITNFSKFTSKLVPTEEAAEKLTKTFEGLFAIVDMIVTVTGGGLKFAFEILKAVLEVLGVDILDITAAVGEAIVNFKEWLESTVDLSGIINFIAPAIANTIKGVHNWIKENVNLVEGFKMVVSAVKGAVDGFRSWIDSLKNSKNLPKDIADGIVSAFGKVVDFFGNTFSTLWDGLTNGFSSVPGDLISGFVNGLWNGIQVAVQVVMELGKAILEKFREVLGIHSPSTETYSDGVNYILGFVNAIVEMAKLAWDAIKAFGEECVNVLARIDFGKVLAGVTSAGLVVGFVKIGNALDKFASPLEGLDDILQNTGKVIGEFRNVLKSYSTSIKAKAIKDIAIALAILVGSIVVLTLVNPDRLWSAVGVLGVLAAGLLAFSYVTGKVSAGGSVNMGKLSAMIIGISVAMLLLSKVAKTMGGMDDNSLKKGLSAIVVLGLIVAALSAVTRLAGDNIKQVGSMLLKVSIAMLLMALTMKSVGGMRDSDFAKGLVAIVAFGAIVVGLIAASKLAGRGVNKLGSTLLKISIAMLLMVGIAKIMAGMDSDTFVKGAAGIIAFGLIITGLIFATKLAGGNTKGIGTTLLGVSIAIGILALIAVMLGSVDSEKLMGGIVAIGALSLIITGLIAATKLFGGNTKGLTLSLLGISVSIGILALIAVLLSLINPADLYKGVGAVAILSVIVAGLIAVTKLAGNCKGEITAIAFAIGAMAAAIAILSFIDGSDLAGATIAIGSLMGVFALMIAATKFAGKSIGSLIVLLFAVAGLAAALGILASMDDVNNVLAVATALSELMLALSAMMVIISKAGKIGLKAIASIAVMVIVTGFLAEILGKLASMEGVSNVLATATGLSLLLLAMSGACLILGVVGNMGAGAFIGIGVLAALIAAVGAIVLGLGAWSSSWSDLETFIDKGIPILEKIGYALGSFVGNILAGLLTGGLPQMGNDLSEFMNNLEDFINGAKSIDESSMAGVKSLAEAILTLVSANIMEGATSWLTGGHSLTDFAQQLSGFGLGIRNFAMNVEGVDPSAVSAAAKAAVELANVANAIPASGGLFQLIGGEHDMGKFAQQLSGLGLGIKNFTDNVANVDPAVVSAAAEAAIDLARVADAIPPSGGLFQLIGGEHDLGKFAQQLSGLGIGIRNFSTNVAGVDPAVVSAAASAAVDLAKVADAIPPSGGLFQLIGGEHDMGKFAQQLSGLGLGINNFSANTVGIDPATVSAAASAAVDLATMAESIPATGGLLQVFTGEHDMDKFAQQLSGLGLGIRNFAMNVGTVDPASVSAAAEAAVDLAEMSNAIPTTGGLFNWCTGEHDMSKFAQQLSGLGTGIRNFSISVGTVDPASVTAGATAGKDLAIMAKEMPGNTDNLNGFGVAMSDFGVNAKDYFNAVGGISPDTLSMADKAITHVKELPTSFDSEGVNNAVSSLENLVSVAASMSGVSSETTKGFSDAMNNLLDINVSNFTTTFNEANGVMRNAGETMVSNLVSGMKCKESEARTSSEKIAKNILTAIRNKYTEFKTVGQTIMHKLMTGIKDKNDAVEDGAIEVVDNCRQKIRDEYDNFKSAGKYVVDGFAAGISANAFAAEAKAAAMAEAALDAAREALDEHSPSKEAYKIGDYFGLGFVNALDDYRGTAFNTAYEMADNAKRGLRGAISKIKDVIDSDIDTQPTIRPVLDLSGVQSGVGSLNGMFGMTPSMGVLANVGSISAMMNSNQNGANDDVVSAIKDLGDRIGEMSGDSYNLGDVTYDDGSNVHNAVKSLVRATRMERRR